MTAVTVLAATIGVAAACDALGVPRASWYRSQMPSAEASTHADSRVRSPAFRSLAANERETMLEVLHSERFIDKAPYEVYAALLDEGRYLCSIRTMYRVLQSADEVRERRNQRRHPNHTKPELLAEAPNQLWSWDITRLKAATKWSYYYLYVIMDVFSRYVVGWTLADAETGDLAKHLIAETCRKHEIEPGSLTIHADNGSPMKAKPVEMLLVDLGVTKSHSRPYKSNDNPFSEAQFRTLKYRPDFPERFGSTQDALAFCRSFFRWYNDQHYHTGLALLTPATVHYGNVRAVLERRQQALDAAYEANPQRFVRGRPLVASPPTQVWINRPYASSGTSEASPVH